MPTSKDSESKGNAPCRDGVERKRSASRPRLLPAELQVQDDLSASSRLSFRLTEIAEQGQRGKIVESRIFVPAGFPSTSSCDGVSRDRHIDLAAGF